LEPKLKSRRVLFKLSLILDLYGTTCSNSPY